MSFLDRTIVEPSDAELIARVRGGDTDAYGDLFERHREAATRLARTLVRGPDADDLVAEAFAKVFKVLLRGGGPDLAFRAYLLTAVRRLNVDKARATKRASPTDDIETLDSGVPFVDPAVTGFESGAAARAFQSLPERWQLVLWHLEVEGQKPADVAPLLGMSPNSVSVLAYRAREGLRQAFLQMHAAGIVDDRCEWTRDKLGAYVRKAASRRDAEKVETHLRQCRPCTAVYLELTEVNSSLSALLGPLVLGGAAAAYLGGGAAATGAATVVGGVIGRVVELVAANTQAAVVTGAAAAVAVAGTVGVVVIRDEPSRSVASSPAVTAQPEVRPDPSQAPPTRKPRTPKPPTAVAPPVVPPTEAPQTSPQTPPEETPTVPGPEPEPQPELAPKSEPEPEPSATPPPGPVVDAAVQMSLQHRGRHLLLQLGGRHLHSVFTVGISGLPEDTSNRLAVTFSQPLLSWGQRFPAGCARTNPHQVTCAAASNGSLRFHVRTRSFDAVTITAALAPVPGDDRRDNDSASVVSSLR